jgi:hypothetical protein
MQLYAHLRKGHWQVSQVDYIKANSRLACGDDESTRHHKQSNAIAIKSPPCVNDAQDSASERNSKCQAFRKGAHNRVRSIINSMVDYSPRFVALLMLMSWLFLVQQELDSEDQVATPVNIALLCRSRACRTLKLEFFHKPSTQKGYTMNRTQIQNPSTGGAQ